jgi:hypothetical protein
MHFRQWLETRLFPSSKQTRPRARRPLTVERLEGRELFAVAHPGIHIPPPGISGPAAVHTRIHTPPMGISHNSPSPSPTGMGSHANTPASVLAEIQQLLGNSSGGGMMGGGMMGGGMMM